MSIVATETSTITFISVPGIVFAKGGNFQFIQLVLGYLLGRVVIAAHGNSLRALVKHFDQISEADIVELNIPTGIPLVYELADDLRPLRKYYLGDQDAIRKAADAVANQGKA